MIFEPMKITNAEACVLETDGYTLTVADDFGDNSPQAGTQLYIAIHDGENGSESCMSLMRERAFELHAFLGRWLSDEH